jgi:hypothetical protein
MNDEKLEVKPAEAPSTPAEKVSSPEVKPEVKQPEVVIDVNKDKEQIGNLNIALKQERESGKQRDQKISDLETQLKDSSDVINRFKQAFSPTEQEKGDDQTQYMTKDEAETFWQQKSQEFERQQNEKKQVEGIKLDIKTLEKEWDGTDGKPKYEDQEVLNWQKQNEKTYLPPREAFFAMKRDEIIDWEVKQRLAGKKDVQVVERPSGGDTTHQPTEFVPKNETETRQAILEAMENAEKGL